MRWRPSADDARTARGSAVVEFVLVLALLVPLVLAILQLGLVLHVRNTLTAAASDGARAGAPLGAGPADAQARARTLTSAALSERFASQVQARQMAVAGVPGIEVVINATVPAFGLWGPAVHLRATGHAVKEVDPQQALR